MSGEFGHVGVIVPGLCLDSWGAGPFVITAGGRYRFEDSDRFGPVLINKNGSEAKAQPGGRSPFWRAHRIWRRQGRRTESDGVTCIWTEPKPSTIAHIGKSRTAFEVEPGEEDGKTIIVEAAPEMIAKFMKEE